MLASKARLGSWSARLTGLIYDANQLNRLAVRIGTTGAIRNMLQEFDPRRPTPRLAPRLIAGVAGVAALSLGWHFTTSDAHGRGGAASLSPIAEAALQHRAFAEAGSQPGLSPARNIALEIASGETFEAAVRRTGVTPAEAHEAVSTLAQAVHFNIFNDLKAGQKVQVAVAAPRDQRGPVRLVGLSMKTDVASTLTLSRTFDGALRLREMEERIRDETKVACGAISGSLDESARQAGATPAQIRQVTDLFAHRLDFARDIQPGDHFCMVFDRKVTESGQMVQGGDLRFAEIEADHLKSQGAVRFYRHLEPGSDKPQYFDEFGKNVRGFLLRTPIDGARITSTFGLRMHPILGYNRVHQGIDFGAPSGTPVYAAGDGVVEEVKLNGGYGRWVKIRHSGDWETGYAHLSRWADGLKPGKHVSQGDLIAYVGTTGRSTGPHLHYEVMEHGAKIDPKGAKVPSGNALAGPQLITFQKERAQIDAMLNAQNAAVQTARLTTPAVAAQGLRPAQVATAK
jgi:murein DD-endopeptidase MepM/ murein hydrolase activator NlpD